MVQLMKWGKNWKNGYEFCSSDHLLQDYRSFHNACCELENAYNNFFAKLSIHKVWQK